MTDVIAVAYVFRSAGSNQMPEPESDVMPVDSLSGSEAEPTSEKPVIESACNPVSEIPAEISAEPESESTQSVVEALEGMMFDPVRPLYRWAIKTNVAYLAATVANLGVEYSFGDHYSIDLPIIYSPYTVARDYRDEIGGELAERRVLGCEPAADGHHTIHTSLALHAARYHVVAWMDYVDNGSVDDKYYTIPSLSSISVPAAGNYIGDEDHKDTYVARQEIDLKAHRDRWNETVDVTVTLQRPMAKIEFIATDIDKFLDELAARHSEITGSVADDLLSQTPDLSTIRVQVDYAGYFPSGFNAYTNKPNDARTGMWFECNMTPLTNKEAHLASDYIFVNGSESAVKVDLTIRDSEGNLLNRIEGIDVPIVRGKLTTIRDEFLTRDYAPGIGIDPGFDGDINITIPD